MVDTIYLILIVTFIMIYALHLNHPMEPMFYYPIELIIISIMKKHNVNQIVNLIIILLNHKI